MSRKQSWFVTLLSLQSFRSVRFLTYLKDTGKFREYELTSVGSLWGKKINHGSPSKVEESRLGADGIHGWRTTKSMGGFWLGSPGLGSCPEQVKSKNQRAPTPTRDCPCRRVWRGEATLTETRGLRAISDGCSQQKCRRMLFRWSADVHRATGPAHVNTRKGTNFLIADKLLVKGVGTNICTPRTAADTAE